MTTQLLARGMPVTHVVDDVQRMMGEAAASLFRRRPTLTVVDGGT